LHPAPEPCHTSLATQSEFVVHSSVQCCIPSPVEIFAQKPVQQSLAEEHRRSDGSGHWSPELPGPLLDVVP
jgi:hypothetical protein